MNQNSLKIYNNYFLKKAHSKSNLKKNKNNPQNNKSYIFYNNLKRNILFDENLKEKLAKIKDCKTNSISTNNQDSLPIENTNKILDSNNITLNKEKKNKEVYIKKLEKKIINKERQLSQLLEYKYLCEKRIKELNPNEILPLTIDSFNTNYYTNRDIKNSNIFNTNSSNRNIKLNSNDLKNYEKTIELNSKNNYYENNYKDKYNNLYNKYIKLFNDFKKINNNTNNVFEVNKLKNKIYKLETEYDNMKEKFQKEKDINEELLLKINNLQKKYDEDFNGKDNVEQLKIQNDVFRKDLVLSQALINSLKSEIEVLNKNQIKKKKRSNSYTKIRNNNSSDNCIFSYNNKKYNNNLKNYINDNNIFKTLNDNKDNNDKTLLIDENNFLKQTLCGKNLLISNILEENNKLNNLLKYNSISNDLNNNLKIINDSDKKTNSSTIPQKIDNDMEKMRKNLNEYENKFIYFNDYITNLKKEINKLYQSIIQTINNFETENNKKNDNNSNNKEFLLETFYKEIENIKEQLNRVNIDFYDLDYSKDIKFIDLYMQFNKIIYQEINNILLIYKNNNFINKKELNSIIDLFELSKALMKDESLKNTLTDILNITLNINNLYKQKYFNFKNNNYLYEENNNLDRILINQEKELEKIKKYLFDINTNSRKTYYIINNYNNNNLSGFSNKTYNNNGNIRNLNDYKPNYTDNYNLGKNFENNKYLRNQNNMNNNDFYSGKKKYSNSKDKIFNRPKL